MQVKIIQEYERTTLKDEHSDKKTTEEEFLKQVKKRMENDLDIVKQVFETTK